MKATRIERTGAALMCLALGSSASARFAGDRAAPVSWGELAIDLQNEDTLIVRLLPDEALDPNAVIPLASDLDKELILRSPAPGGLAIIEIGLLPPGLTQREDGFLEGKVISGFFGENGEFVVPVPKELDLKDVGVRAARLPDQFVSDVIDLEDAVQQAYASWNPLGGIDSNPNRIGAPGSKTGLPQLDTGAGHALPNDIGGLDEGLQPPIEDPQQAGAPGSKIPLPIPLDIGMDHVDGSEFGDPLANPEQASPDDKILLPRLDTGVGHTLPNDIGGLDEGLQPPMDDPQQAGAPGSKIPLPFESGVILDPMDGTPIDDPLQAGTPGSGFDLTNPSADDGVTWDPVDPGDGLPTVDVPTDDGAVDDGGVTVDPVDPGDGLPTVDVPTEPNTGSTGTTFDKVGDVAKPQQQVPR